MVGQPLVKIKRSDGGAAKAEDKPAAEKKPAEGPSDKSADKSSAAPPPQVLVCLFCFSSFFVNM